MCSFNLQPQGGDNDRLIYKIKIDCNQLLAWQKRFSLERYARNMRLDLEEPFQESKINVIQVV